MRINLLNLPHAGQMLRLQVYGGEKESTIRVQGYIDQQKIIEKDCPDPPCHEMFIIPADTKGSELMLIAYDNLGNSEQVKFSIEDGDENPSDLMNFPD